MCGKYDVGCCKECKLKGTEQTKGAVVWGGRERLAFHPVFYGEPGSTGQVLPMHLIIRLHWPTPIGSVEEAQIQGSTIHRATQALQARPRGCDMHIQQRSASDCRWCVCACVCAMSLSRLHMSIGHGLPRDKVVPKSYSLLHTCCVEANLCFYL